MLSSFENPETKWSDSMTVNSSSKLTIVVPIYNEEACLVALLEKLIPLCEAENWELILVNDGSQDRSAFYLAAAENPPRVRIVQHKVNRGYGGALKSGIAAAQTPYVITIDGDGQHDEQEIAQFLEAAIIENADLVVGDRMGVGSGWYRSMGKWLIRRFTKFLMPLHIRDLNSGFKLYRRELVQKYLYLCPDSMAFSDVITLIFINRRDRVIERPIKVSSRQAGHSTITSLTAIQTLHEILLITVLFNPGRVFYSLSFLSILMGIVWGVPLVMLGRGVSVGAMLAMVSGLLFFAVGLIATQLSAIRMSRLD